MTLTELATKLRPLIEKAASMLDAEDSLSCPELFPQWKPSTAYTSGQRVRHGDFLYNVLQSHTSQQDWTPDVSHSLFAKVLIEDNTVVPEWEQPGATNPYMAGDIVMFNGGKYQSVIDNNVWSPSAYPAGWKAIAD